MTNLSSLANVSKEGASERAREREREYCVRATDCSEIQLLPLTPVYQLKSLKNSARAGGFRRPATFPNLYGFAARVGPFSHYSASLRVDAQVSVEVG